MEKRIRKQATGTCSVANVSPGGAPATGPGSVVNLVLSFEDALKLNLALDEALHRVNRYNRGTATGRRAGVRLVVYLGKRRINVMEGQIPG